MHQTSVARCISASLTLSMLAMSVVACEKANPAATAPLPVHVEMVKSISVGNGATYSANIVPYAQVDLAFQSSGYIDSILQVQSPSGGRRSIDQGDWVTKGTVLAVVRQQDYLDKLQQAKAQLTRAQAEQEKAKLSFDRVSALYATQSATKPDYDSAKAQMESTTASVSGASAQVGEANVALAYCSLQAPFDGWVVKRNVDVGSFVGPATNGFTVADTHSVKAVFGVPDTSIGRVKLGEHLVIRTDALANPVNGRVSAISPAADAKSRVFSVEVTILNPKNQLKSGMIASLTLNGEEIPHSVLAVPMSAMIRDPSRANAFAVMTAEGDGDLQQARLRAVDVGDIYGNFIAVKGGVQAGEKVITSGASLVKSGDNIRIIP